MYIILMITIIVHQKNKFNMPKNENCMGKTSNIVIKALKIVTNASRQLGFIKKMGSLAFWVKPRKL